MPDPSQPANKRKKSRKPKSRPLTPKAMLLSTGDPDTIIIHDIEALASTNYLPLSTHIGAVVPNLGVLGRHLNTDLNISPTSYIRADDLKQSMMVIELINWIRVNKLSLPPSDLQP